MRLPKIAILAAAAAGSLGVFATAHATTFAEYSATSEFDNLQWIQVTDPFTRTTSGFLEAGGDPVSQFTADVNFNFLTPSLSTLGTLPATLLLASRSPDPTPAQSFGGYLDEPNISGLFQFTYTGTATLTINGKTFHTGANLLSGTFTDASIFGQNGSSAGAVTADTATGSTIAMKSAFLKFGTGEQDFALELTSIANPLSATAGKALNSFGAVSTGSFDSALTGGGNLSVPEPDSWALMLIGLGGLGLALRGKARRPLAG